MTLGTIKSLKPDPANREKSYGFATKSGSVKGYHFTAREIQGVAFTELKVGDAVRFDLSDDDDNKIVRLTKVCNDPERQIDTSTGTIKSLKPDLANREKSYGFATKSGSVKGYHFTAREIQGVAFTELKVGDAVRFDLSDDDDNKIVRLTKVCNGPERQIDTSTKSSILAKTSLVDNLIDVLNVIPEISESDKFEDAVFMLLKILGINDVFQYERADQAGKADGFFICQNLAVLYDCTLCEDYYSYKKDQIENYINKLSESQLTMNVRESDGRTLEKTFSLNGKNRHVWIITTKNTHAIRAFESIRVKEIAVQDLIKLAKRRLHADTFDANQLSSQLATIGDGVSKAT